jgi:hypothetical protein
MDAHREDVRGSCITLNTVGEYPLGIMGTYPNRRSKTYTIAVTPQGTVRAAVLLTDDENRTHKAAALKRSPAFVLSAVACARSLR